MILLQAHGPPSTSTARPPTPIIGTARRSLTGKWLSPAVKTRLVMTWGKHGDTTLKPTFGPKQRTVRRSHKVRPYPRAGLRQVSFCSAARTTACFSGDTWLFTPDPSPNVPTITSFAPQNGGPGTQVTITGTGFTGTEVKFGGTAAASFTVDSSTQITAVVGQGSTGKVTVTTDGGTATSTENFTFNAAIPTLSEWAMILLAILLTVLALWQMRLNRTATIHSD